MSTTVISSCVAGFNLIVLVWLLAMVRLANEKKVLAIAAVLMFFNLASLTVQLMILRNILRHP